MATKDGWGWLVGAVGIGTVALLIPRRLGEKLAAKNPSQSEAQKLAALQPQVRDALLRVRARLLAKGIRILIGQTRRTINQVEENYDKGASATLNSWHLLGRAVDVYPYGPDGKPDMAGKNVALFKTLHDEAAKEGFRGIAFNPDGTRRYITVNKGKPNERKVWDGGHIEFPQGMTFAQAASKDGIRTAWKGFQWVCIT